MTFGLPVQPAMRTNMKAVTSKVLMLRKLTGLLKQFININFRSNFKQQPCQMKRHFAYSLNVL